MEVLRKSSRSDCDLGRKSEAREQRIGQAGSTIRQI
jgi:hypothetical protein